MITITIFLTIVLDDTVNIYKENIYLILNVLAAFVVKLASFAFIRRFVVKF